MVDFAITPDKWGPSGWRFFHYATLAYPIDPVSSDKLNMLNFIESFGKILPCNTCRNHFKNNLIINPITDSVLSSRNNLVSWGIDMHNLVNKQLGKKVYTQKEAMESLTNMVNGTTNNTHLVIMGVLLLVFIIIIFIKYKYY